MKLSTMELQGFPAFFDGPDPKSICISLKLIWIKEVLKLQNNKM